MHNVELEIDGQAFALSCLLCLSRFDLFSSKVNDLLGAYEFIGDMPIPVYFFEVVHHSA